MGRRPIVAIAAALAVTLGACAEEGSGGDEPPEPSFNAGLGQVFNPSDEKGGTLRFGHAGDWADSVDPGNTYYGYSWNFARLYARTLVTSNPAPGEAGQELVPDLAESLGEPSDGGRTWTYRLREGLRFEDGSPITSADVKYAVARSIDKDVHPLGPSYFDSLLAWPEGYRGPYRDPDANIDSAIETPDDRTVVFHLEQPFASFDYLARIPQTAPVPEHADTGTGYAEQVVSSGPYRFAEYEPGKRFVLERNPEWDPATDPVRPALPDRIEVQLGMEPNDVDNQVLSGDLDADILGSGAQPAAISRVLADPALKPRIDNPQLARLWWVSIIPAIEPFDDIDCRRAVMHGIDQVSYQAGFGGPLTGDLATSLIPPLIAGHTEQDVYSAGPDRTGDLDAARAALRACGEPDGFETTMAYRAERLGEKAAAESVQQSLSRIGIEVTLRGMPGNGYFSDYCGRAAWLADNGVGLCAHGGGADWLEGFGWLSWFLDSRNIRAAGNYNLSVNLPEVDRLLDAGAAELDEQTRQAIWSRVDRRVLEEAVIYPGIYPRLVMLRPRSATNVFVTDAYQMYDYVAMGAGP